VIAGVGLSSSKADYESVGVPFDQRWQRFDQAVRLLKVLLQPTEAAASGFCYPVPVAALPRRCGECPPPIARPADALHTRSHPSACPQRAIVQSIRSGAVQAATLASQFAVHIGGS
jgi:alkanesulfonate monooxygenase SsuD/methylene tetrahydromethanopterin reductase-like flavin-dependent oxidoreductase (luciferase family)